MNHRRLQQLFVAATCTTLTAALTGCGLGVSGDAAKTSVTPAAHQIGGNVHGGQQAMANATVTLWAAGVSGTGTANYGANSALIATTTSDLNGNFGFNNLAGVSPCTPGQYLYITATGGNEAGLATNANSAMMAALPTPCSANTGSSFIFINEVTTVSAVWSLQQFMKIAPGAAVPWTIGAPSTNVTGLANAFLTSSNLANVSNGTTATSSTSNAVSNTVSGQLYTTVVKPDYLKINTLANILASCVNDSTQCAPLFADTTPSGSTAPADTIQVAYYLATNPAGLTMPAHGNTAGSPSYLCGAYPSAAAPFQPTLTCSSTYEWTISVSWKTTSPATGTPANATTGTLDAASLAFDASGNIWVGAGTGFANGAVNEFNTAGQLILAPVTSATVAAYNLNYVVGGNITALSQPGSTSTLGYGRPNSISIDTAGNAWFGAYGTASPGTYVNGATSVPTGVVAEVSPTGTVTGYLAGSNAGALAIDGNNDVFVGDIPQTGKYYISELPASSYQTLNAGNGRGSSIFNYVLADQSGNGIAFSSSATCTSYVVQRNNTAQEAAALASPVNTASDLTLPSNCAYAGAVDAAGNIWGVASGNLYYLNIAAGTVSMTTTTPVITTFTGSTNTAVATAGGQGGLDSPSGVALDGVGNVWVVNRLSSTTSGANGVSEFVPTTTAAGVTTVTPLSPSAAGVYGFGSGAGIGGANQPVIDGSGNLWITTTAGSYLNFLVGVAAPVVTPTAVALKNNTIAVRP